jgi:phosphopantothenoylcysteine decarboxylase/phosphopantothenate--cysteine ligase
MWEHAATQANVATLSERGVHVIPPASGRLTGADTGPGRLPEPEELYAVCERVLAHRHFAGPPTSTPHDAGDAALPLAGRRVVVSAGGTREPLDPVRFLGNRSSGKQGYALAAVAAARGADVTLLAANTSLVPPAGVRVVPVQTALDLQQAVAEAADEADVVIMAAAVADFRPAEYAATKMKKSHDPAAPEAAPTIELVRNPDILAGLVAARGDQASPVIVGFAAETGDADGSVLDHGRAKLARKGCDLLVVNEVGEDRTFGQDHNTVHILRPGSSHVVDAGPASKEEIAAAVWDAVQQIL